MQNWYTALFVIDYRIATNWTLAGRVEYFKDRNGIIVSTGTPNGFNTLGYSLNVDYSPVENFLMRIEVKTYNSQDAIFVKDNVMQKSNTAVTASMSFQF